MTGILNEAVRSCVEHNGWTEQEVRNVLEIRWTAEVRIRPSCVRKAPDGWEIDMPEAVRHAGA